MKQSKTIIITGTHHTPAIELIKLLQSNKEVDWQIHYIGHLYPSETHILHTIVPKFKVPFYNLNSGKFDRKNIIPTITNIPKIFISIFKSLQLIHKIKPDIIVSFGGYVSVPVIVAGFFNNIPSITHEQTLTESLSTKINRIFVNKVALSFPSTKTSSKDIVTGNLIRSDIYNTSSAKFNKYKKPIIYITGGNQGSEFLNNLIINLLPNLKKYTIIHQTGNKIINQQNYPNYHHFEYIEIEDIGWVLNNAEIIISRAGANICQEIDLLNKNSILIPLIFTQQDEQTKNALWLEQRHPKTTRVIPQDLANPQTILGAINELPKTNNKINPPKLNFIHPLIKLINELTS